MAAVPRRAVSFVHQLGHIRHNSFFIFPVIEAPRMPAGNTSRHLLGRICIRVVFLLERQGPEQEQRECRAPGTQARVLRLRSFRLNRNGSNGPAFAELLRVEAQRRRALTNPAREIRRVWVCTGLCYLSLPLDSRL